MKSFLLAPIALLLSTSAVATEIKVVGADPTPHYQVYSGDLLDMRKPMGRELKADGSRDKTFSVWIDRQDGKGFAVDGATKLGYVGHDDVKGYVYQPLDAQPLPTPVSVPTPVVTKTLPGVNFAGCYAAAGGALCPSVDEINNAWAAGARIFRFAIKMDPATPFNKLTPAIDRVLALGGKVIIDRHDYDWQSVADQIAYWEKLAVAYKGNPNVYFDLNNEPRNFNSVTEPNDFMQWAEDTRDIGLGLAKDGFTNPIAAEWPQNSAIFRFDKSEGPTKACESAGCAIDRIGGFGTANIVLSPHTYLDHGSSGTSPNCDPYSFTDSFAAQARTRHLTAMVGEAAGGKYSGVPASCVAPLKATVDGIYNNPDVYVGVTWWGFGRDWPASYIYAAAPKGQSFDNPYVHELLNH